MIRFVSELDPVKFGFNFYRLSDKNNFGFKLKLFSNIYFVRYSKPKKIWFICKYKILVN